MNCVEFCIHDPKDFFSLKEAYQHKVYNIDGVTRIVPSRFSKDIINPKNFFQLKNKLEIESILILDYITGLKREVCVIDHVNRSGYNFLIGKTPYQDFPTFPDMTNIYRAVNNLEPVGVQTVGPERFKDLKEIDGYISESVGLLSPIWSYVGVPVYAKNLF